MLLIITSFIAGALSVLAPCVIALLPVLLARSSDGTRKRSPFYIILGLSSSIFIFSIILKSTTLLIDIPTHTWQMLSGTIIVLFGLTYLFPSVWERVSMALRLQERANKTSGKALQRQGLVGDLLLGASLGPVFSACSPTYALIVASILPATPVAGVLYLVSFIAGLAVMLTLITVFGSKLVQKLGWGINPSGRFKRILGTIFVIVGLLIATGVDKQILSYVVSHGWYNWQVALESTLQQ